MNRSGHQYKLGPEPYLDLYVYGKSIDLSDYIKHWKEKEKLLKK